jgi:peptidoglycan/LPS O-acetylase OafA/YrhL
MWKRVAAEPESRIAYLDSIRGIAALLVVAYHCWIAAEARERLGLTGAPHSAAALLWQVLAKFFEAGRASVMLFFVLSGYVLARSLAKHRVSYGGYAIKRILRIYPAFLVVLAASYLLHRTLGTPPHSPSILMDRLTNPDLGALEFLKALAMWGTERSVDLDLVTWSLVHEMRISLIFPLILWAVRANARASLALFAAMSVSCTLALYFTEGRVAFGFVETSVAQSLLVTGYFVVFFAGGAYLSEARDFVSPRIAAVGTPSKMAAALFMAAVFLVGDHGAKALGTSLIDYAHGGAAVGVIALTMGTPEIRRILNHRALVWLGRISYSLYLVHLPILYVVTALGLSAPWVTTVTVIAASLAAAELGARWIELPAMRLGKQLAAQVSPRPG